MSDLFKGALKSAISSACALIIGLPMIDPDKFTIATWGGWKHLLLMIGITILVSEARFWKQWADAVTTPKS